MLLAHAPARALGAEHALGHHAADLGGGDAPAAGQSRARRGANAARRPGAALGAPQTTETACGPAGPRGRGECGGRARLAQLALDGLDLADHHAGQALRGQGGEAWPPRRPALTRRSASCAGGRSRVDELAQPAHREIFTAPRGELLEEAQVVLEEEADVVDAVLEHGHALDAHAERPARDLFRVVADVAQHVGMHHARAQDLEPAPTACRTGSRRRRT